MVGTYFNMFFHFISNNIWWFSGNGFSGKNTKLKESMDWKEKGTETIFVGVIAFFGSIFVKKIKPMWKELRRISKLTDGVDDLVKKSDIAEKRLRAVLYSSSDPIFINNNEGEVVFVNPAWLALTGMKTEKDAYGFGYMAVIPEDDRDDRERDNKRLVDHPSSFEGEIRFQHFITKEIIVTMCRSEPVEYDGELVETIGRLTIIKK